MPSEYVLEKYEEMKLYIEMQCNAKAAAYCLSKMQNNDTKMWHNAALLVEKKIHIYVGFSFFVCKSNGIFL